MAESMHRHLREQFKKLDADAKRKSDDVWESYRTDAIEYFSEPKNEAEISLIHDFPEGERELREGFAQRHARGEKVLVFDVCGIADAKSMGADHTACLVLSPQIKVKKITRSRSIFVGDVFRKESLSPLLQLAEGMGTRPCCIFFIPVGGLSGVPATNTVQGAILIKQFNKLYDLLAPGGVMYIQMPWQFLITLQGHRPVRGNEILEQLVGETGTIKQGEHHVVLFKIKKNEDPSAIRSGGGVVK
jgi:hypothetical protein